MASGWRRSTRSSRSFPASATRWNRSLRKPVVRFSELSASAGKADGSMPRNRAVACSVPAGSVTSCSKSITCTRLDPERVEPTRQEVGVAATAERHELLVLGVEEVVGPEAVGGGQVVLERKVGGDPQPHLLVGEERDGAAHRLAEHEQHVRIRPAGPASPRRPARDRRTPRGSLRGARGGRRHRRSRRPTPPPARAAGRTRAGRK